MKRKQFIPTWNYSKAFYFVILAVFLLGGLFAGQSYGETAKEIDDNTDAAMDRFYKIVKDAKEVVQRSRGMLILPNVIKGALIIGGEYGQGAMRIDGKTVDYYNMISVSVGFQIGGQAKDIIFAFMSSEALKKFRNSKDGKPGLMVTLH